MAEEIKEYKFGNKFPFRENPSELSDQAVRLGYEAHFLYMQLIDAESIMRSDAPASKKKSLLKDVANFEIAHKRIAGSIDPDFASYFPFTEKILDEIEDKYFNFKEETRKFVYKNLTPKAIQRMPKELKLILDPNNLYFI